MTLEFESDLNEYLSSLTRIKQTMQYERKSQQKAREQAMMTSLVRKAHSSEVWRNEMELLFDKEISDDDNFEIEEFAEFAEKESSTTSRSTIRIYHHSFGSENSDTSMTSLSDISVSCDDESDHALSDESDESDEYCDSESGTSLSNPLHDDDLSCFDQFDDACIYFCGNDDDSYWLETQIQKSNASVDMIFNGLQIGKICTPKFNKTIVKKSGVSGVSFANVGADCDAYGVGYNY